MVIGFRAKADERVRLRGLSRASGGPPVPSVGALALLLDVAS